MFNWPLRGMVLLMLLIAVGCNGAANQIDTADHSQIGAEPVCDATVADISGSCSPSYLTPQGAAESVQVLDNGSRIIRNLSYAVHGGLTLQGDLYLPAAVDADTGALVTIHGGGWQDCGRRRNAADAVALVLSSIATVPVFNIDYRLRQEGGGYPDNLSDVVCAAQFISEQAESYGFSGDRVALMGESAGAHLALMASLVGDRPDINPGCALMPEIVATIAMSPPTDFPTIVSDNTPVTQAVTSYTGSQCPRVVEGCGAAPDCDSCIDASPIAHACNADSEYLLVHAFDGYDPFIDDQHINDFVAALRRSAATVNLVSAAEELLTEAGCPVGTPVHGFTDCLTIVAGSEIVELLNRVLK